MLMMLMLMLMRRCCFRRNKLTVFCLLVIQFFLLIACLFNKMYMLRSNPPTSSLQEQLRPDTWAARFAPPPEDIYWENLNRSNYRVFKVELMWNPGSRQFISSNFPWFNIHHEYYFYYFNQYYCCCFIFVIILSTVLNVLYLGLVK